MFQTRHFVLFLAIEISHTLCFLYYQLSSNCCTHLNISRFSLFIFVLCADFDFALRCCFLPIALLLVRLLGPSCTFSITQPPPGGVNAAAAFVVLIMQTNVAYNN